MVTTSVIMVRFGGEPSALQKFAQIEHSQISLWVNVLKLSTQGIVPYFLRPHEDY